MLFSRLLSSSFPLSVLFTVLPFFLKLSRTSAPFSGLFNRAKISPATTILSPFHPFSQGKHVWFIFPAVRRKGLRKACVSSPLLPYTPVCGETTDREPGRLPLKEHVRLSRGFCYPSSTTDVLLVLRYSRLRWFSFFFLSAHDGCEAPAFS